MRYRPFVLVADDEPDTAGSTAEVLQHFGFDARAACTPQDVISQASARGPDAVVMDLGWPGSDGYALADAICRVAGRRPLLVAMTGYHGTEGRTAAAGFDHHLLKPTSPVALAQLLANALGGGSSLPDAIQQPAGA